MCRAISLVLGKHWGTKPQRNVHCHWLFTSSLSVHEATHLPYLADCVPSAVQKSEQKESLLFGCHFGKNWHLCVCTEIRPKDSVLVQCLFASGVWTWRLFAVEKLLQICRYFVFKSQIGDMWQCQKWLDSDEKSQRIQGGRQISLVPVCF